MILVGFICFVLWIVWSLHRLISYRFHDFSGKTVLITGACSELGSRLCYRLHTQGANIIAWDYNHQNLEHLKGAILSCTSSSSVDRDGGVKSHVVAGEQSSSPSFTVTMVNLSSQTHVLRAAQEVVGQIDVVLNASHVFPAQPFLKRAHDSVGGILHNNSVTPLLVAKILCPSMLQRREGGQYVSFITSQGASTVDADNPDYAASQWAATGLHYSIRAWLLNEKQQQRCPGHVYTTLVSLPVWQESITKIEKDGGLFAVPNFSLRTSVTVSKYVTKSSHRKDSVSTEGTTRALNAHVDLALHAIARREEYYGGQRSWVMFLRALTLVSLPFPWQTFLSGIWGHNYSLEKVKIHEK